MSNTTCDCGNDKPRTAPACSDCEWQDGSTAREARLIDALRKHSTPQTVRDLASQTDTVTRNVLRSIKPLLANGRVLRTEREGEAYYTLGTKRISTKSQLEIPGAERECIDDLDDAIVELLDCKAQVEQWKERVEEAQEILDIRMLRYEQELEADEEGVRRYEFIDGDRRHIAELPPLREKRHARLSTKKIKPPLEVVA